MISDAGGATDPSTHIAQQHAPFTQHGWNGKAIDGVIDGTESMKSRGENEGLAYRTVQHTRSAAYPGTAGLVPGRCPQSPDGLQCSPSGD